jgi:hypothetical protein
MKKGYQVCAECDRQMERCRACTQLADGTIVWVCRQCWRDLDYDKYMYEHRTPKGYGHGV